jgi:acetyl-CoA acetyltransferase
MYVSKIHRKRLSGKGFANSNKSSAKDPNDVVITCALRTPLTKALKGGLKDTPLDLMVNALLKEVLSRSKLDPSLVQDVCLGNVSRDGLAILLNLLTLTFSGPRP